MNKTRKIVISQIFFLAITSLIANKAFFSHVHILPDGKIIVHAHPYSKEKEDSEKVNHTHTKFSFHVIEHSCRFDKVLIEFQNFDFKLDLSSFCKIFVCYNLTFDSFFSEFINDRGPPSQFS